MNVFRVEATQEKAHVCRINSAFQLVHANDNKNFENCRYFCNLIGLSFHYLVITPKLIITILLDQFSFTVLKRQS